MVVSGLAPAKLYHWRSRILTDSPFFPRSRWLWHPGNAVTEADLRTPAVIGVAEPSGVPAAPLRLEPTFPNPFGRATEVAFTLPDAGVHRLAVYDVQGREVAVLTEGPARRGRRQARWDGRGSSGAKLAAGVYFLRLDFAGGSATQKVVLTR